VTRWPAGENTGVDVTGTQSLGLDVGAGNRGAVEPVGEGGLAGDGDAEVTFGRRDCDAGECGGGGGRGLGGEREGEELAGFLRRTTKRAVPSASVWRAMGWPAALRRVADFGASTGSLKATTCAGEVGGRRGEGEAVVAGECGGGEEEAGEDEGGDGEGAAHGEATK